LADELAISDRITFTGFVDYTKLIALIKSSKVFVLPSSREGFGLSILEASACGIPVISVEHEKNAATELIHKGIPGLACELNESDMAEKIMEVLSNTKRFSTQENTNFIEQYDWSTITEKVESYFYSSCVMNKP
jgi:glycosyltransferase involved in cell wall biosynthesis